MKLMGLEDYQVHQTLSNYQFSAIGLDSLEGSEYTIVQILVDSSGSVCNYARDLEKVIKKVLEACGKSPRSENLLIRVAAFSSYLPGNIEELHGFTLLNSLDPARYNGSLKPHGGTPLYDAALNSLESLETFSTNLVNQDYLVNAILFVVTDGYENSSRIRNPRKIKKTVAKLVRQESLESLRTILVGLDDEHINDVLCNFKDEVGFDEYLSLGQVSASKLAKMAEFVSQSIAATSQALGTGGPSRKIDFIP